MIGKAIVTAAALILLSASAGQPGEAGGGAAKHAAMSESDLLVLCRLGLSEDQWKSIDALFAEYEAKTAELRKQSDKIVQRAIDSVGDAQKAYSDKEAAEAKKKVEELENQIAALYAERDSKIPALLGSEQQRAKYALAARLVSEMNSKEGACINEAVDLVTNDKKPQAEKDKRFAELDLIVKGIRAEYAKKLDEEVGPLKPRGR